MWNKLFFIESVKHMDMVDYSDCTVHILCTAGGMGFVFQDIRYNIVAGDYVILPNLLFASDFSESRDFQAIIMGLSSTFVNSMDNRSNYGVIGQLSLMQNPVMKLNPTEFRRCKEDMVRLHERLEDKNHLFHEEMLGHLLMAHVLDLHSIHAQGKAFLQLSEHISSLLRRFIDMLYNGEYLRNRDLTYYASELCITPHYLSEISKRASGMPASYWIDRFTLQEACRLLCKPELTLTEIADKLNFSSVSYFSRYVKKRLGVYPTEYRNNLSEKIKSGHY